jgi:hypothetical protein
MRKSKTELNIKALQKLKKSHNKGTRAYKALTQAIRLLKNTIVIDINPSNSFIDLKK